MKRTASSRKDTMVRLLSVLAVVLVSVLSVQAQEIERVTVMTSAPQELTAMVGQSILIETPEKVKKVSIDPPEVADFSLLTPQKIFLTGKEMGVANLILRDKDNIAFAVYHVKVIPNVVEIKEKLHTVLPSEHDLRVTASHDSIVLSGSVSSQAVLATALSLVEPYAPEKTVNLLQVDGVHQVMLEVRVAEMAKSLTRRLGFNYNYISSSGNNLGLSLLNDLVGLPEDGWPGNPLEVSDPVNYLFTFFGEDTSWQVFIDALKENGLVRILAEPTLITLSGQEANFLAGGEFPIPVPQELGRTTIQYKKFGVGLSFTPTVLHKNKISMRVAPEVSELDFTNAVSFSGFVIPALTTRRVSTVIELGDGQSFAIAGLLQSNIKELVSKYPLLGDIPVLGALFRSTSFEKDESELIIIVTPHLVKPLDLAKQTLPTDQYIEPNDYEFYLLGNLEGEGSGEPTQSFIKPGSPEASRGLEGDFGHILPE